MRFKKKTYYFNEVFIAPRCNECDNYNVKEGGRGRWTYTVGNFCVFMQGNNINSNKTEKLKVYIVIPKQLLKINHYKLMQSSIAEKPIRTFKFSSNLGCKILENTLCSIFNSIFQF